MDGQQSSSLDLPAQPMPQDGAPVPAQAAAPPPPMPQQQQTAAAQHADAPSGAPASNLDQEWVDKAKDIVEQTKGDPFLRSQQLNKVRAGFMKARFNKDLKVAEDGSK